MAKGDYTDDAPTIFTVLFHQFAKFTIIQKCGGNNLNNSTFEL